MLGKINFNRISELEEVSELAGQGLTLEEISKIKGLDIETIKHIILDAEQFLKELREQFDEFKF